MACAVAVSACAGPSDEPTDSAPRTTEPTSVETELPGSKTSVDEEVSRVEPTATSLTETTSPNATTLAEPVLAIYSAVVSEITPELKARMAASWREGCPVDLGELRHIELAHWNYKADPVTGELIVAATAAEDIVGVFELLFEAGYPIERMDLVDAFSADDNLSMAANNTSAFNCREVAWRPGVWSVHALGLAIDINPLVNPYVSATRLLPPEGAQYADRSLVVPGLIVADDTVVRAFADIGWTWGGYWTTAKDYQHFSATGR